ncbi:MAG TPA: hypothetical protein VF619_09985 [Allosphingosinicella sp.]|jgi:hypothetical protein
MSVAQLDRLEQDLPVLKKTLRAAAASPVGELQQKAVHISRGIPLYRLQSLPGGRLELTAARLHAWRYLVFGRTGGEALLIVEVEDSEPGGEEGRAAAIVGSAEAAGELLDRLSTAGAMATGQEYELRIVEIPEADEEALWLHGGSDRFLDIIRAERREPEDSDQFLRRVQAVVELRSRPENIHANEIGGEA